MTEFDYVVIAIVGISTLMSLTKGLIKEAMSLGTWVVAFFGSRMLAPKAQPFLADIIADPFYLKIASMAGVFILILILGSVVRWALSALVSATGLTMTDRLLGMVFGAARGALVVTVAVALINLSPFRGDDWFTQSLLVPKFIEVAEWSVATLWDGSLKES